MKRKGLSFTLTIVVVGVILLMTALSLITLSGTSISQFFNTLSGKQKDTVKDSEIASACRELANEINNNYCGQYVKMTYSDSAGDDKSGQCPGQVCDGGAYDSSDWSSDCAGGVQASRVVRSLELANNSNPAYEKTATSLGCKWSHYSGLSGFSNKPMVTVEGNEYNCEKQGHITGKKCPAG